MSTVGGSVRFFFFFLPSLSQPAENRWQKCGFNRRRVTSICYFHFSKAQALPKPTCYSFFGHGKIQKKMRFQLSNANSELAIIPCIAKCIISLISSIQFVVKRLKMFITVYQTHSIFVDLPLQCELFISICPFHLVCISMNWAIAMIYLRFKAIEVYVFSSSHQILVLRRICVCIKHSFCFGSWLFN